MEWFKKINLRTEKVSSSNMDVGNDDQLLEQRLQQVVSPPEAYPVTDEASFMRVYHIALNRIYQILDIKI